MESIFGSIFCHFEGPQNRDVPYEIQTFGNLSRHWTGSACKAVNIITAASILLSEVACCMRFSHVYKGHGWNCIHFLHLLIEVACCMCSSHVYKGLDRALHALRGDHRKSYLHLIEWGCLLHAFVARLQGGCVWVCVGVCGCGCVCVCVCVCVWWVCVCELRN